MKLAFDLLCDSRNSRRGLRRRYAITRRPDQGICQPRSIDLPTFDGDNRWRPPVPARIVLAQGGVVVGIEADSDYMRRPEPEETLAVLRSLA
jgi:hypothetical protein